MKLWRVLKDSICPNFGQKWHVDCFYENLQLSTFTRCNTATFFWVVTNSVPLISNSLSHFLSDFAFHPTYYVTVFRRRAENKLSDEGKQTLSKVRSLEQQDWQKKGRNKTNEEEVKKKVWGRGREVRKGDQRVIWGGGLKW